jgi:hypothetical protein
VGGQLGPWQRFTGDWKLVEERVAPAPPQLEPHRALLRQWAQDGTFGLAYGLVKGMTNPDAGERVRLQEQGKRRPVEGFALAATIEPFEQNARGGHQKRLYRSAIEGHPIVLCPRSLEQKTSQMRRSGSRLRISRAQALTRRSFARSRLPLVLTLGITFPWRDRPQ